MGVFVDYLPARFPNLQDVETTILTSDTNPLLVTSIRVTNRTDATILINLKNVRQEEFTSTITYERNNFAIKKYQTKDLVRELLPDGANFHLEFNSVSSVSESLKIYSNGYTQKFDCNLSYVKLNDLPPTP